MGPELTSSRPPGCCRRCESVWDVVVWNTLQGQSPVVDTGVAAEQRPVIHTHEIATNKETLYKPYRLAGAWLRIHCLSLRLHLRQGVHGPPAHTEYSKDWCHIVQCKLNGYEVLLTWSLQLWQVWLSSQFHLFANQDSTEPSEPDKNKSTALGCIAVGCLFIGNCAKEFASKLFPKIIMKRYYVVLWLKDCT